MAMNKKTAAIINNLKEYKGFSFTEKEWKRILNYELSFETFKKYVLVQTIEKIEVPLEKVVTLLNDCAGNDCYDCEWYYVTENNKIYEVVTKYKWE
jgi:hypothetical protein